MTQTEKTLLDLIKLRLRVSGTDFDEEIESLIDAALIELNIVGVIKDKLKEDKLALNAISLYCKAYFGLSNADSEKYITSFETMRTQMALSSRYKGE